MLGDLGMVCSPLPSCFAVFQRKFQLFSAVFRMFSISLQPISCWLRGFFAFCSSFQFIFMFSILYLLNKEDFHYEHHYRHRPRLVRYQNSALFISGWTYQLRRTRTLHPPRTLRVWRVLFCLWLRAAAYPA